MIDVSSSFQLLILMRGRALHLLTGGFLIIFSRSARLTHESLNVRQFDCGCAHFNGQFEKSRRGVCAQELVRALSKFQSGMSITARTPQITQYMALSEEYDLYDAPYMPKNCL